MSDHVHRWRLESPNGGHYVPGSCACGATKQFQVSHEDQTWKESKGIAFNNAPREPKPIVHNAYRYEVGCRCDECRDAKREKERGQRERRQAKQPAKAPTEKRSRYAPAADVMAAIQAQRPSNATWEAKTG